MRKVWAGLLVLLVVGVVAAPADAKSKKPDGVPTGMWIDFCDHTYDLTAALGVIDEHSPDTFVDDELTKVELSFRRDAAKLGSKNSTFAKQVLALAKATGKTRAEWDSNGTLKLRALSIAAHSIPDCG